MAKLDLKGTKNARDLGGLEAHDGRRVKSGRLLRAGNLSMLTCEDIELLKRLGLKRVLDFRTQTVINSTPNVKIDGVEYIHIPIVQELATRVMSKNDYQTKTIGDILLHFTADFQGKGYEWMQSFYRDLYSSDYSLSQYKIFFDYLKETTQGATIFHCTAGKDRTGVGAILFLSALGIKREQILDDYLKTNESAIIDVREAQAIGRAQGYDEEIILDIERVNCVLPEYARAVFDFIDTYPSEMDFFKAKMGIDEDYINALRDNYLE